MSDPENKKPKDIAALQSLIDAVPASPERAATEDETEFAAFINEKLYLANAPQPLMDALSGMAAKIYGKYDLSEPLDVVILNNKLTHLIALTSSLEDTNAPLPAAIERQVKAVMRDKV